MNAETTQNITQIISITIIPLLISAIIYGLKIANSYLESKIKDKRITNIVNYSEKAISDSVTTVLNDYKDKLLSDGKFTKEEEAEALAKAQLMAKNIISGSLENGIKQLVPDSEVWISEKIKCAFVDTINKATSNTTTK